MSKYNARKVIVDGITFDSKVESEFYLFAKTLQDKGYIKSIKCHPQYVLLPTFISDIRQERMVMYESDFEITDCFGNVEVIDIKGMPTPEAKLKRKWFLYTYKMPLHWLIKSNKYGSCGWVDYFVAEKIRRKNKKEKR